MEQTKAVTQLNKLTAIDKLARESREAIEQAKGEFVIAHATGVAIAEMESALTEEVMKPIMALQNNPLGFKTDNKAGYPVDVVRRVLVAAVIRGARVSGNEFNIIKEQCYVTKEGYQGKIRRCKAITDFRSDLGVPKTQNGGAIVSCKATWKKDGTPDSKDAEIPVRMDGASTIDNILGKAERKFLKRVWEQMSGNSEPDGDAEEADIKPANVTNVETAKPNFGNAKEGVLNV